MSKWKITSQKTVYKGKLFKVKELTIALPNNKKKIHSIVERDSTAIVFPITDSFDIYLISQYRYFFEKNILEAVSGFVERDENPLSAAKRELKEETGIEARQWEEIARVNTGASVVRGKAYLFMARDLEIGNPNREDGEKISLVKLSLEEAVKKVEMGEITTSTSMIGILLLDRLRKEKKLKTK